MDTPETTSHIWERNEQRFERVKEVIDKIIDELIEKGLEYGEIRLALETVSRKMLYRYAQSISLKEEKE